MVDKICNWLMARVRAKMPEVDEERAEVIRYGFELIIGEVPKLIVMFIIALLLGKIKLFLISVAIICPYRTFSGGIHLKTHIGCFIVTNGLYLGNVYLSQQIVFYNSITKVILTIAIFFFSVLMILLYAPADTDTVPILRRKDRRKKKIYSIIWMSAVLVLAILIKDRVISNMCLFGIFMQTVTISKLTYKLFNVKLGYLEYKKSL